MKKLLILFLALLLLPLPPTVCAVGDGYIIRIKPNPRLSRSVLISTEIEEIGQNKGVYYVKSLNDIPKLSALGEIEYIESNYTVTLFAAPNDEYYAEQINLQVVKAEKAWDIGCYGNDVIIGVIDSGIVEHPDLNANVIEGYNYLDDNNDTVDVIGHGTFVSGIIAARQNKIGIVGIAHKSKIVPLKCFGEGMTTTLKAVVDVIYGAVDDFNCEIINMSFGLSANPLSLSEAIDYAVSKDTIIVAAVGNDGNNTLYYPAAYDNVIGVGSVDNDKNVSSFSQRNNSVFVTAPGRDIKSLSLDRDYRTDLGTSCSAPIVAGLLAVSKCIDGNINVESAKLLLSNTAEDLGDNGYDLSYGYGLVNAETMIKKMLDGIDWFVSPFDFDDEVYYITVYNNSEIKQNAVSIFAGYSYNKFENMKISDIVLTPKESAVLSLESDLSQIKHFLWQDIQRLEPLYNSQIAAHNKN